MSLSTVSYPNIQITGLLNDWGNGETDALERLYPLVFDELRRMASQNLRKEYYSSLQPTALVHEVFVKLLKRRSLSWKNRRQFFAFVGIEMRRILVDRARKRRTERRGWGWSSVTLDEAVAVAERREVDLVALDDALNDLERLDPELCQVVMLNYFVGLSQEEIAEVLECARATVGRRLRAARTWLFREMSRSAGSRGAPSSESDHEPEGGEEAPDGAADGDHPRTSPNGSRSDG